MSTFDFYKPTDEAIDQMEIVRHDFTELSRLLHKKCPDGREKSIANTKLEEACMWAIKAIGHADKHTHPS